MRARGKPVVIASVKPLRPAEAAVSTCDHVDRSDALTSVMFTRTKREQLVKGPAAVAQNLLPGVGLVGALGL